MTESANVLELPDNATNTAIQRVARNSVWLVAGQIVAKIFTFGYVLTLAHYLGVEAFGAFNLVMSFVMVADIATDFGLTRLIIRDLARDLSHLPRYLGILLPLKIVLVVLGYLIMIGSVALMGYRSEVAALAVLAGLGMLPLGLGTVLDATCHAHQRMKWSSLAQIALAITQALVGGIVLLAGGGVWAAVAVSVLANGAFFMVQLWASRQLGFKIHWSLRPMAAIALLRQSLPYAGVALLGALAMRAELEKSHGDEIRYRGVSRAIWEGLAPARHQRSETIQRPKFYQRGPRGRRPPAWPAWDRGMPRPPRPCAC